MVGTGEVSNHGIYISDGDYTVVKGNRISNFYTAISVSALGVVIEGNVLFSNLRTGFGGGYGMNLLHEGSNIVRDNNVTRNEVGIVIFSQNNIIENNTVYDNEIGINYKKGILPVKFGTVRNNTIYDHPEDGIKVEGCANITIVDNVMRDNYKAIYIESDSQFIDIINNSINSNSQGISVGSHITTNTNNTDIVIRDNNICTNFLDVYCEDNQTFVNNKCFVQPVCGGVCLQCW